MAWSRRDLLAKDNAKLEVHNPKPVQAPTYKEVSEWTKTPEMQKIAKNTMGTVMWIAGEWPSELIATKISKMFPMIKKAWSGVMERFSKLLTKVKGNPEAMAKIVTKLESVWDDIPGMMLHPSQLQKTNPNYLENINAVSKFKSRPIKEPSGKQKIDGWLDIRNMF